MCPSEELIQMACFELPSGKTFRAHKHIPKCSEHNITQESWIVVQGSVQAILYDVDDTILEKVTLCAGDCSITFRGGHNYKALEDHTIVYEAKTGPYLGQEQDKVFVDTQATRTPREIQLDEMEQQGVKLTKLTESPNAKNGDQS